MRSWVQRLFGFALVCTSLFIMQACVTDDDSSESSSSFDGYWRMERNIDVYEIEEGVWQRDTISLEYFFPGDFFLKIVGTNFQTFVLNDESGEIDTTVLVAVKGNGGKWTIDGDPSVITRKGNTIELRSFDEDYGDSSIVEFSLYTELFPPLDWNKIDSVLDTTGHDSSLIGFEGSLWLAVSSSTWVDDGEVIFTDHGGFDTTNPEEMFFLRFSNDSLYQINIDTSGLVAAQRTGPVTWSSLNNYVIRFQHPIPTRLILEMSGYDENLNVLFKIQNTYVRYNGVFPPPVWAGFKSGVLKKPGMTDFTFGGLVGKGNR